MGFPFWKKWIPEKYELGTSKPKTTWVTVLNFWAQNLASTMSKSISLIPLESHFQTRKSEFGVITPLGRAVQTVQIADHIILLGIATTFSALKTPNPIFRFKIEFFLQFSNYRELNVDDREM